MPNLEIFRNISSAGLEARGDSLLGTDFLTRRPDWVSGNISDYDARFLSGLVNFSGARTIAEIGVASGWSSAVMLNAVSGLAAGARVSGIDLSPTYYLDSSRQTGSAVSEIVPELRGAYQLLTGRLAFQAMDDIGEVEFAFIDGHHMHPWATLDLLSILPFIGKGRWIALHDLNLCRFPKHKHTNRGPFYLFHMWPDQKIHSTQDPSMIGAILLERKPADYLVNLLEILYTPWEIFIEDSDREQFLSFIRSKFGDEWAENFGECFRKMSQS